MTRRQAFTQAPPSHLQVVFAHYFPFPSQLLLANGASVDALTKAGITPLIYAANEGWDDCLPLLLQAGADRDHKTNKVPRLYNC